MATGGSTRLKAAPGLSRAGWRIVLLASLGGTLEFYDFVIFGIFAKDIADAIFPGKTPLASLMSVFVMSGATLGMGFVPDYARAGAAASALMVALRLIQGFCLGGELPGALAYVVETAAEVAPLVCGVVFACVTMGVAAATGVNLAVRAALAPAMRRRARARHPAGRVLAIAYRRCCCSALARC
jgi:MFS family permease